MADRAVTKRPAPTATSYRNKADRLFSLIVRTRDGCCQECGATEHLQCAHGLSRRYRNTRWDESQCWALCRACHMRFTNDPIRWELWMRNRLGNEGYETLQREALEIAPKPDWPALIARLSERWAEIKEAA